MSLVPRAHQIALDNARKAMTAQLQREVARRRKIRVKAVIRYLPSTVKGT